ncbi:Retrovirus-related Pol polyprotein from transposon TNT 1-94 [Vitis vinifera]|uniref:Retrovirus-related Pol polyprotein from transposon TNT 1-94 n=1 Tax=Vitis vinifera TaxID=29760 RepID=A0A438GHD8_VITVI|nr:Retrovirus-related Pol polyprotein from transposon TNT 1-94 [Vitis vinifera]
MVLIYYQPGKTGKTPDELWKGYAPNIAYLKVWGCLAKFLLHELKKRKLGPKTFNAMLVSSGAPLNLWEEAILSACHIQNRISYKKFLGSKFDMKDLGEANVILGIKINRTPNGLKLSQKHYVEKILRKFEHFDCKSVSTPYYPSSQLKKNKEHSVAQIEYAHIIGSLMYLMNCTKTDLAYVVGRLSRYTQSPNQVHWTIVHLFLKYLRGTINYGLCFSGFPSVLEGFSDANWISDSDEVKSTSGYVFIFGRSVVSWKSAKRICITRSTMEVEFIALENASSEVE